MLNFLTEPFQYEFMIRSFSAAVVVGIVCAVIGCYVVIQSMAFLGDALSHAILPGVAIAYLTGGNLTIGALIAAILVSIGISAVSSEEGIKEDTAIGIFFTAALALGVALISSIRSYAVDLTHILFGNILGVDAQELKFIIIVAAAVLLTIVVCYRFFLVVTFDPVMAKTINWNVRLIRTSLLILIACTITISINTVGASLVTAMLITPAASALMITKELRHTMVISAGMGAVSGIVGLYISYYAGVSSGAAIVLTATLFFVIIYICSKIKKHRLEIQDAELPNTIQKEDK